jgi:hypothetical protein
MNIIDEMRKEAEEADGAGCTIWGGILRDWADRLAASGALVPVPQGEAAPIIDMATEFFIHNSVVYRVPEYGFYGVPLGHDGPHYTACHGTSDTIVQPVALVPITEAEV